METCVSTEGTYVPWSFGEWFACVACGAKVPQSHTIQALRGESESAVYPIPVHERRVRDGG